MNSPKRNLYPGIRGLVARSEPPGNRLATVAPIRIDQASGPYRIGAVPGSEGIHRDLSLPASVILLAQQQLLGRVLSAGQTLHADSDEADAHALETEGVIEPADGVVDVLANVGGPRQGP